MGYFMKLNEILSEGRSEKIQTLKIPGTDVYSVDLVKNFTKSGEVEIYADVYTGANKKKHGERIYSGLMADVNIEELKKK